MCKLNYNFCFAYCSTGSELNQYSNCLDVKYGFKKLINSYKFVTVCAGLVSKPTGQVEEAQEDNQCVPFARSPAAITRSATFRLHVRRPLPVRNVRHHWFALGCLRNDARWVLRLSLGREAQFLNNTLKNIYKLLIYNYIFLVFFFINCSI